MIEWEQNPPKEPMNWHNAVEYAKSLGEGWRLPTRAELIDAYDNNIKGFKDSYYWSSSTYDETFDYAWDVNFKGGHVDGTRKSNGDYVYVRCVREDKGE